MAPEETPAAPAAAPEPAVKVIQPDAAPAPTAEAPKPVETAVPEPAKQPEPPKEEFKLKAHTEEPSLLDQIKEDKPAEEPAKPVETKPEEPAKPDAEAKPPEKDEKPAETKAPEPTPSPTYEFKLPEDVKLDDTKLGEFKGFLGEHKVAPEAAQGLMDRFVREQKDLRNRVMQDQHDIYLKMRRDWRAESMADPEIGGARWETAKKIIAQGRDFLVRPEEFDQFNFLTSLTGVGEHSLFLKMLYRVGASRKEPAPMPATEAKPVAHKPPRRATIFYDHPSSQKMSKKP